MKIYHEIQNIMKLSRKIESAAESLESATEPRIIMGMDGVITVYWNDYDEDEQQSVIALVKKATEDGWEDAEMLALIGKFKRALRHLEREYSKYGPSGTHVDRGSDGSRKAKEAA